MYKSNNWVENELSDSPMRDDRLVRRLIKITSLLSEHPHCSIPEACGNWNETKATYRLLDNTRVTPEVIFMGHKQQTIERMKTHDVILAIQDTTSLDFTQHRNIQGLGLYGSGNFAKGLLVHTTLATTIDGIPLGILSQDIWTRDPIQQGKRGKRNILPMEEKESYKWFKALKSSLQGIPQHITVVTVCDREADIYEFLHAAISEGKHLLIRATSNTAKRKIDEEYDDVISKLQSSPIAGEVIINIPRDTDHNRPPREARLSIQYCPVTIKPPEVLKRYGKKLSNIQMYTVLAKEVNPPEGITPIYWILITTLPVLIFEDAVEKVKWYRQRWKIERFHLTLKSGCKVEELQLETLDRLYNALAIYSIVAWRLLWITLEARDNPDTPITKT